MPHGQNKAPKLPVPNLDATLDKYLRSVRPLLSDADYSRTVAAVEEFRALNGAGERLQNRLLARARDPKVANWVEDWWIRSYYLGYRDSVAINTSYFIAYPDDPLRASPAARAASLVTAVLNFREQIMDRTLPCDYSKHGNLCMDQYYRIFNTCRMPSKPADYQKTFDPAQNNHIVIVRHNQFYVMETRHEKKRLSTADLEAQFANIIARTDESEDLSIGVLTTENRDVWADCRDHLIKGNSSNKAALEIIESSAFLVCFDNDAPFTNGELSRACWHGDGHNRFFDKSLQIVVFENGRAGIVVEHSCVDGTPTAHLSEYILDTISQKKPEASSYSCPNLLSPIKLCFYLTPNVRRAIISASQSIGTLIASNDLQVLTYNGYGKSLIKYFGVSPDAYVQMTIQLAYYDLFGVCRPTYESVHTRKFHRGRTDVCRGVSIESVRWVEAMEDPALPIEVKAALGKEAIESHVRYSADGVQGRGIERHLLGLRHALHPDEPIPALFTDPAFSYSSHWYVSTSQVSSERFEGFGYGQVVPDGFGIAYIIKNDSLHFNVASLRHPTMHGELFPDAAKKMRASLQEAAERMRYVFEAGLSTKMIADSRL